VKTRERTSPARLQLEPGRNCWRVERAERLRCVQDGAEYFRLVREAVLAARQNVFILGWDIAGKVDLAPGGGHAEPSRLAELLDFVARRRRGLRCHVLIWDYAAFYAIERDPFSRVRLGLRTHRHVVFRYDDRHPFGASHHQKLVVVDDRLALLGGIDLTHHRWDTSEHRVDEPLRLNAMGKPYEPYHEVGIMLEGPAAAALGELARERWRRRGWRRRLPRVASGGESLWPRDVEPDLLDVDVAISRTEPEFARRPAVRECEQLFVDGIAAAREAIYIENQYFTHEGLAEALAARLREPRGPEVVVIGPRECEGWLERKTMGALRGRVLAELQAADTHGRLRLVYPLASRAQEVCTFVHSKVMIVDDELLRVGSANLSHRSMGFDTECDLAVAADDRPEVRAGIRGVRARLLAEHLGQSPEEVEAALAREGSLCAAVDALGGGDRTLAPCKVSADAEEPAEVVSDVADPDHPMAVSQAVDRLLPEIVATDRRSAILVWMLPAATLSAALLVSWRALEAGRRFTLPALRELLSALPPSGEVLALALPVFVLSAALFVPLELLVFLAVLVFGPGHGGALALVGVLLSALLGWGVGRALGGQRLLPWLGARGRRLWPQLHGRGVLTLALLHLVSVASANRIHLLAGAARVPLRDVLAGALVGIAPVMLALGTLAVLVRRLLLDPDRLTAAATAALALVLAVLVRRARRTLIRRRFAPELEQRRERDAFG
jgi:phospholipase D1/2